MRHADAVIRRQLLGAGQALKVLVRPVALLHGGRQESLGRGAVVAPELAGHKAAGHRGVGEDGDLLLGQPLAVLRVLGAGDGDAAAPAVLNLVGQGVVRAHGAEAVHAVFGGEGVGLAETLHGPVGRAVDADLPFLLELVQHGDDFAHRHIGIVAVEHVNVNIFAVELRKRIIKITEQVKRRHALAIEIGVAALGEDHGLVHAAAIL